MTKIEWTRGDDGSEGISWNCLRAEIKMHNGPKRTATHCEHVTDGCKFCYAERMNRRHGGLAFKPGNRKHYKFVIDHEKLTWPLRRKKPTRWFVESMSDTFGEWWPQPFIEKLYAVMAICPQHTFINLTKRPERRCAFLTDPKLRESLSEWAWVLSKTRTDHIVWPIPNVIEGISVSDQADADKWIPVLNLTPCATRMISAEPLLAPIDFMAIDNETPGNEWLTNWIIVGGESHHSAKLARPFDIDWARSIIAQCRQSGAACFVKQLGSNPYSDGRPMHANPIGKYTDPSEWPEDIRVREFPKMPMMEAA